MSASRIIRLHDGTPVTVDADDYERLSRYRWSKNGNGYARTGSNSRLMHRLIMHAPKGKVVDHINGDIYDNRKRNLRVCCQRANAKKHRRKCVQLDRRYGTWRAAIKVDYVTATSAPTRPRHRLRRPTSVPPVTTSVHSRTRRLRTHNRNALTNSDTKRVCAAVSGESSAVRPCGIRMRPEFALQVGSGISASSRPRRQPPVRLTVLLGGLAIQAGNSTSPRRPPREPQPDSRLPAGHQ